LINKLRFIHIKAIAIPQFLKILYADRQFSHGIHKQQEILLCPFFKKFLNTLQRYKTFSLLFAWVHFKLSHPVIDFVFLLRASAIQASSIALRLPIGFLLAARQSPNKFVLCSRSQRRLASVASVAKQSRELKIEN